jgi:hypothetical protein
MCKSFVRVAMVAALAGLGSGEAQDISQAGAMAMAAARPRAAASASRSSLAQLVRDTGLSAEEDGGAFTVTVDAGGEPISLMVRSERQALVSEPVLAIWSTLLCVDGEMANAPGVLRALSKVTQSAPDRISTREEREQLLVVYESSVSSRGLTSAGLRSRLEADAGAVQRALHLLRLELAKPAAGG